MTLLNSTAARWCIALAWTGLIFWLSHQPTVPLPGIPGVDKLAHVTEYGLYALFVARAIFPNLKRDSAAQGWGPVLAWCLFYAITDEIHQAYVPGRSSDWLDVLADGAGALLCAMLLSRSGSPRWTRLSRLILGAGVWLVAFRR